ncbi:MAG: transglutaminase domain-containing protein [Bacteroidales bacterium]|nr:transglutaminase domain-containing protein [Bacteroidales bacterium]
MLKRLIFALLAMFLVSVVIKLFIHRPEPPVISNPAYLEMVEEAFELKKVFIDNDSLFSIFEKCKGKREREALMFLYAYMPIGDIADYNPDLFLEAVRHSFKMRRKMPWGKSIPEDIFRHFVLPLRANNEALDSSRVLFYKELKGRVKNLSLYDAVIEVNRWCQEKVVYTPSDERTSSPLATVRTAYGRCGEESVFTVAAMRSVGIPARQVYTPRWAHTDDNHAWVEVWVEGEWHYLGACEPEPKLNVAWFSATAQRGLLMHCRVFGYYSGDEDIIKRTDVFTEINVTANYAPVAKVKVRVTDSDGNPVEGAGVDYKIYNYAELYSAISSVTGADGFSEATLGKGDIVVWAYKDGKFGFKKVTPGGQNGGPGAGRDSGPNAGTSAGLEEVVQIVLDRREGEVFAADLDIVPPAEGKASVDISQEEREENNRRIARGDSLRRAYIATFADSSYVAALVKRLEESGKIVADSGQSGADNGQSGAKEKIARFVYASRGNYREIADFLEWLPAESFQTGLNTLELITEKDLRDTPSKVLRSHITNLPKQINEPEGEIFNKYVLNPRVGKEQLGCWREFLSKEFARGGEEGGKEILISNPQAIIDFCRKIKPASKYNPQNIPVTPVGVYKLMAAERASAQGLFIAICRTFGIPARFEEVTGKLQYYLESAWVEANIFDEGGEIIGNVGQIAGDKNTSATGSVTNYGRLMVNYRGKVVDDPKFESHFTIARIENGGINTLNFRSKEGFEGTNTLRGTFKEPVKLEVGYYSLTCGTRMASGKVLSRVSFFNIEAGKTTNLELIMRDDPQDLRVIGNLNPEARFFNNTASKEQSIVECTGRGFFVLVFLRSNHEPSTHAIRDILKNSDAFGRLATSAILLFKENKQLEDMAAVRDISDNLPKSFTMGVDPGGKILSEVSASLKLGDNPDLPLVVIADTFGRIVWYTMGYNIGTGGQTLNAFARTQSNIPHTLAD